MNPLVVFVAVAITGDPGAGEDVSCGIAALYGLCQLEEVGVSVAELKAAARDAGAAELAFTDLIRLAAERGLPLTAVHLGNRRRLPDRHFIAHLQAPGTGRNGHFILLRPVGRNGRQYQVIDPPGFPRLVAETEFAAQYPFTGWILQRRPPVTACQVVGLGLIAAGGGMLAVMIARRWRKTLLLSDT